MDETIPIPVMTTRFMIASSCRYSCDAMLCDDRAGSAGRGALPEQPDLQVLGAIDNLVIHGKPPVADPKHQLRTHHALHIDMVHNLAGVRQHLTGEFQFTETERTAASLAT